MKKINGNKKQLKDDKNGELLELKQMLRKMTEKRDIENGIKERKKYLKFDEVEEEVKTSTSSSGSLELSKYFSIVLYHDTFQHKNEYVLHPRLHMYISKDMGKLKHLLQFIAVRNKFKAKEYQKFQIYEIDKATMKRQTLENAEMLLSDFYRSRQIGIAENVTLFYKIDVTK